jgi:hypothetical protein
MLNEMVKDVGNRADGSPARSLTLAEHFSMKVVQVAKK